jgi:sugar/nucleoside kinase (ribokinase family)
MSALDVSLVGELNLDLILYGLPRELEPEREHLAAGLAMTLGSSSAIFAHNLSVLGSRVGFITRIGDDPLGRIALDRLAEGGVDVSCVKEVPGPIKSGLTVILTRPTYRNILTYPGTMFEMDYGDLDLPYLKSARHFHLSSYYLHRSLRPRLVELVREMKEAGLTTSLDINDDPEDLWAEDSREVLKYIDVFFPNEREAKKITGEEDLETALAKLSERVPVLAVKLGPKGAVLIHKGERLTLPPLKIAAIDPVGAGDSFDAGFLHHFVRGADLPTCLHYGNVAGAFSTTRPGGTEAFRERAYVAEFFRQNHRA